MVTPIVENSEKKQTPVTVPEELAILPSGESVIFPSMIIPLGTDDVKTIKLIDEVATGDNVIGIFAQRPGVEGQPPDNLHEVGTAASIVKLLRMPDGSIRAILQGICRIKLKEMVQVEPYLKGKVERLEESVEKTPELEAIVRNVGALFQKVVSLAPNLPDELSVAAVNMTDPGSLADFVAAHINLNLEESQYILETLNVQTRLLTIIGFLNKELEILERSSKIQSNVKTEIDKAKDARSKRNGPVYCPKCGVKNPSDSDYCTKCGGKINS